MIAGRWLARIFLAAVAFTASQALACPFCAQGAGRYGPGFSLLMGMMMILPFAAVGLVLRQVLRTEDSPSLGTPAGMPAYSAGLSQGLTRDSKET